MSIQAVILETGETIITDVQEVIDPQENKSLGYKLTNPFVLNLDYSQPANTTIEGGEATDAKVDFTPWCPIASERQFQVERDFCRVIYKVHGSLEELYVNTLANWDEYNMNKVDVETARTHVTTSMGDNPFSGQAEDSMMNIRNVESTALDKGAVPNE
tara:strand:+ start:540 stop:1013 length:474 start_codon:yes stop_codon:yes gene_type:complete